AIDTVACMPRRQRRAPRFANPGHEFARSIYLFAGRGVKEKSALTWWQSTVNVSLTWPGTTEGLARRATASVAAASGAWVADVRSSRVLRGHVRSWNVNPRVGDEHPSYTGRPYKRYRAPLP